MHGATPTYDDIVIRVRDLQFRYPGATRDALAGISLDVRRGEFVGVTGPSGAGKSTLCLCLKGLIPAGTLGGTISAAGQPVAPAAAYIVSGALAFQHPEPHISGLTVAQDLAFGPESLRREPVGIRTATPRFLGEDGGANPDG